MAAAGGPTPVPRIRWHRRCRDSLPRSRRAALADGLDRWVWGGLVTQLARLGEFTGLMNREADEGGLNRGFDRTSAALRGAGRTYSRAQTGEAHGYLRTVVLAFVVFALVLLLGGVR